MRCSEFKDLHCCFVDDTLAGVELVRMQRHVAECEDCAAMDARVRRSLIAVRNLRPIEPSTDFSSRLEARLRDCRAHDEHRMGNSFRNVAVIGALVSLAMLTYVAESLHATGARVGDIVLPSAVAPAIPRASAAAPLAADTTPAPGIVASVSTGMPIWPAALLVDQAQLQTETYTEAR